MIVVFILLFSTLILHFIEKNFSCFYRLKVVFRDYIIALKNLNGLTKNIDANQILFKNISSKGSNLLILLIICLIPYICSSLILFLKEFDFYLVLTISLIPYLYLIKLKK